MDCHKSTIEPFTHKHSPSDSECLAAWGKQFEKPSVWAPENFYLTKSGSGIISWIGREWQAKIVDLITEYQYVYVLASTQIGKTVCLYTVWGWWVDMVGTDALIAYEDKDHCKDAFDDYLKPTVEKTLKHLLTGQNNDVKQRKFSFINSITRAGSCNVEATFSMHSYDFCAGDEVAKWKSNFDAVGMMDGRKHAYRGLPGIHAREMLVSSPKTIDDPLMKLVNAKGVLRLEVKVPCPHCGGYHVMEDAYIHEVLNKEGVCDHDSVRILLDDAAEYYCPNCGGQILDDDRPAMVEKCILAAMDEEIDKKGKIINPDPKRGYGYKVAVRVNRLVSFPNAYPFSKCLSAFFEAQQSSDPQKWQTYQNEHMARPIDTQTNCLDVDYVLGKALDYKQGGAANFAPHGVICATAGIDTMDNGFVYIIRGWGVSMESWLLRSGFIKCDMKNPQYKDNPKVVAAHFHTEYDAILPKYADGRYVPVVLEMVDEGGHRKEDVVEICRKRITMKPYKGMGDKAPMWRLSMDKETIQGNTWQWSLRVGLHLESSTWHVPADVDREYAAQVVRQYTKSVINRDGTVTQVKVSGGEDHSRDCENYALCAAHIAGLSQMLANDESAGKLKVKVAIAEKSRRQDKSETGAVSEKRPRKHYAVAGRRVASRMW